MIADIRLYMLQTTYASVRGVVFLIDTREELMAVYTCTIRLVKSRSYVSIKKTAPLTGV